MAGMNDAESSAQAHLTWDVTNRNVNDVSDNVPTVVVNELLCFVNKKINLLPSETVIQLCVKHIFQLLRLSLECKRIHRAFVFLIYLH